MKYAVLFKCKSSSVIASYQHVYHYGLLTNLPITVNDLKFAKQLLFFLLANQQFEACIYLNKYKEKLVILQSIGIIVIKSKETSVITYTCRYSSGNLIPNSS